MAHVFISYQRQDSHFARVLRSRIVAAGMDVWMDDVLHAGEDWRTTIDDAIREAFTLIVIVTSAAKRSEYVTYEWACAWGANVHVLPVLLERVPLHPRLDTLQRYDFSNPAAQPFDLLIEDLRHLRDRDAAQRRDQDVPLQVTYAVEELNAFKIEDRHHALDVLAAIPHPAAFTALKDAVTSAFYDDVRLLAALRVIERDPAHCAMALPLLAATFSDTANGQPATLDRDLVENILDALHDVRDPDAVPDLIALHNSGDDYTHRVIRHAVEQMGASAVQPLMALLHDSDDNVQQTVSRLLIAIGDDAVPVLIEALRTSHTVVRFIAAHILGEIGSAEAVPAMIEAMDRSDTHLQRVLVYALGRMADERAIPALITRLDDRDVQTVAATVEALSRMEAQEAVPALCHVVHRPEPTLKLAAIQALGRLGDPRAAETLIDALKYEELQFQLVVVEALGRIRAEKAVPTLIDMLYTNQDLTVQNAVEKALERIDSDATAAALLRWRSPGDTKPLPPLDDLLPDVSQRTWTPRAPFSAPPARKDTLFDESTPDDLDLFSDDSDEDDLTTFGDWLDVDV